MREAIGSAFIVNLILVFIGVISALLVGSISYSKAYKIKDRIVYVIEKYDGYTTCDMNDSKSMCAQKEIDKQLKSIGYKVGTGSTFNCETILQRRYGSNYKTENLVHGADLGYNQYNYCVYKNKYDSSPGDYYTVITFMEFDIPLIGGLLKFPISGETSLIYEPIDN